MHLGIKKILFLSLFAPVYLFSGDGLPKKEALKFDLGNLTGSLLIKYKPEAFYGNHINMLNHNIDYDRVLFSRSTLDFNLGLDFGKACYGSDALNFLATMRNKAVWGDPESIARTTSSSIKILDVVTGDHEHFITKQIMWIRELWLKADINTALNLPFQNKHYFTLGAFPFQLGRGISLGAAYAVNPGPLGFFSSNSIDQYAFGYKINGDLIAKRLSYDLYGAILDNKFVSFTQTAENIYTSRQDHFYKPQRGAGHINYVIAGRVKWLPRTDEKVTSVVEPYFMMNRAPETKVDFQFDSSGILGTVGMAAEFTIGNFEIGFDGSRNLGGQSVFGWDRNRLDTMNNGGAFNVIYTDVLTDDPSVNPSAPKAIYDPNSTNGKALKALVEQSSRSQNASQNGLAIGTVGATTYYNSLNRFRNAYNVKAEGWMFVTDAAYWFHQRQCRVAVAAGVASGDEDPHKDLENPNNSKEDGNYKGFIGLQEIYTGNRVESVFLMGGVGRIPRLLSPASSKQVTNRFPSKTSSFTNLVYTGASFYWTPKWCERRIDIRPNILSYWQQTATKKFDLATKLSSSEYARKHLGVEVNGFTSIELVKDFQAYLVGSTFVPGAHYKDVRGTPLNKDQLAILDRLQDEGVSLNDLPLLWDNVAWTLNIGLEYKF